MNWFFSMEQMNTPLKTPLLGMTLTQLKEVVAQAGLPAFTAKQIAGWIYDKKVRTIDEMTNISVRNREKLSEKYIIGCTEPVEAQRSVDGTVKYLYQTLKGDYIETVFIPEADRIVPAAAQERAWGALGVTPVRTGEPHWCPEALQRAIHGEV